MSNGKFNKIGVISARCLCENIALLTNMKGTNQTPPLLYRVSLCSVPRRTFQRRHGAETCGEVLRSAELSGAETCSAGS